QPIDVVAKLVELAQRARQRQVVRRKQDRRNAVELIGGLVLHLPIGFDLALQPDEFVSALIGAAQNLQSHRAHHNQESLDGEEGHQQLDLHASRYARNKAGERARFSHYRSLARLKRSRRNSSGSKRTPRYWTRRMPRWSTIEVRNECSMSPSAFFAAKTP